MTLNPNLKPVINGCVPHSPTLRATSVDQETKPNLPSYAGRTHTAPLRGKREDQARSGLQRRIETRSWICPRSIVKVPFVWTLRILKGPRQAGFSLSPEEKWLFI